MYGAKSLFLQAPRRISGSSERLKDVWIWLKEASNRCKYGFARISDTFADDVCSHITVFASSRVYLGTSGRLFVVSRWLQYASNRCKYGFACTSDAFKDVIEVYRFEAWFLKDVCSQITVFANSKKYLGGFRRSVNCLKMAQRRIKPLQIWFCRHLGRFQRRHWSVQVRSLIFQGCMQPIYCFCKLQDISRGLQDVCKMSQESLETLQTVASTVSYALQTLFKDVIEVHKLGAWFLKDVCSQIAVFASSKTYLGGFRTSVRCLKMAQRRFKPLQIRFRMHLGRFQRRHWSVQVRSMIFKGCMQPNHCFQNGSRW